LYRIHSEAANSIPFEVEALLPRNNPKLADRQLGALVYKEMAATRFLSGSAAAVKWETILQTIISRGNVTEVDIRNFMIQGIAAAVDKEFKDITVAASRKTAIKQALTAFFSSPTQAAYNGLKLYKYQNEELYSDVEFLESEAENEFESAEYFKAKGNTALAESSRKAAEAARNLANSMKAANAYITVIRALNNNLADRILQDSQ
jgi:hypothetical protein